MSEVPDVLYKYRDWGDEYHRRILTHREIFFAPSDSFNDPFDCTIQPKINPAKADEKAMLERAYEVLRFHHPLVPEDQLRAKATARMRSPAYNDRAERRAWLREFERVRRDCFGIVSLTALPDHNLMWSHYACAHTGFCVGLDVQKLTEDEAVLQRVNYVSQYPDWEYLDLPMSIGQFILDAVTTKSLDWAYESEWRLLKATKGRHESLTDRDRTVKLPSGAIREVYMGCRMPKEKREEILDALRAYGDSVRVFAAKAERSFDLTFEELPWKNGRHRAHREVRQMKRSQSAKGPLTRRGSKRSSRERG